jgi:N-acetylglucosaminyl-diphospho-decaprenol L-rhamnosyltransferase
MASIAVLVVAYQSSDELPPLIKSIAGAHGPAHAVDVLVVDNSQDADEIAALSSMPGIHTFLASPDNLGYGGGVNALVGTVEKEYDWLLVVNPDVRFTPGSIDALITATNDHPNAAIFGPLIKAPSGAVYPSARAFPSLRTGIGHALFANVWRGNPWTMRYHRFRDTPLERDQVVDWLSGACLLVRPAAFKLISGFDEGYFMYFEDVDLAFRLSKLGWESVFVPTSVIVHSGAHSTSRQADFMRKVHHKSARRYLDKKYTGWYLAPIRWALRFALFVRREWLPLVTRGRRQHR